MALDTQVTDRYSAVFLRNLTNPDDADATTNDTTRLARAVTDVQAAFETYAGVEYDDTDPKHVEVGVACVINYLKARGTAAGKKADALLDKCYERLDKLRNIQAGKRIQPKTSSTAVPVPRKAEAPIFDHSRFSDIAPRPPPSVDPNAL